MDTATIGWQRLLDDMESALISLAEQISAGTGSSLTPLFIFAGYDLPMLPNQQNGMDPQDQRNFIIAMALMIVFVFGYQAFVLDPAAKRANEAREAAAARGRITETIDSTAPGSA